MSSPVSHDGETMKIEIRVNEERLSELVTVDELIGLEEGKIKTMRDVLAKFVVGENGNFLEEEEGRKAIRQMTIAQLKESSLQFMRMAEGAGVPPENGGGRGLSLQRG